MREIASFLVVCLFALLILGVVIPMSIENNVNADVLLCQNITASYPKMTNRIDTNRDIKTCMVLVRGDGGYTSWIPAQTFINGLEVKK